MVSLGTFPTKADANAHLTAAVADSQRGGFIPPDRGRVPLVEYANEWLDGHPTLAPDTRDLYRHTLDRYILPHLGDAHLGAIEPSTVDRWFATLGEETTAGQRAHAYRLLRTICNHAVRNERIVRNPCMIPKGGHIQHKERPIATVEQVFALADAMPEPLRAMVPIAALGSLRVGEVCGLQRRDIDVARGRVAVERHVQSLDDGSILVKAPKAGSIRAVALPGQVMELVVAHMDAYCGPEAEDFLFTRPEGSLMYHLYVNRWWRKAREAVCAADPTLAKDFRFHDLRGTGATLATTHGASLKEVLARLGHRTTRAALIYQHATEDRDRTIADQLGQAIDRAR